MPLVEGRLGNKRAWVRQTGFLTRLPFYSLIAFVTFLAAPQTGWSQTEASDPLFRPLESLKGKSPALPDLSGIVTDTSWVRAAGKALFWDQNVGSDTVACATCHFRSGADPRITNQVNPGLLGGDSVFGASNGSGLMGSGQAAGPNITLTPKDFPFHKLADPGNADSRVLFDSNDVSSSQGTFSGGFVSSKEFPRQTPRATNTDNCNTLIHPVFNVDGKGVRKVEPRNSPTAINAVFNHRNFWDGRANNVFNGAGVFGLRDIRKNPTARLVVTQPDGSLALQALELRNASAASQGVGPVLSEFEMSCGGRTFADVGRKLMAQKALELQKVDLQDSLFGRQGPVGDMIAASMIGLKYTYQDLVKKAFDKKFWAASGKYRIKQATDGTVSLVQDSTGYTQMELNFPLFFGVSIMMYEATLISDDSPFDRDQLTEVQRRGKEIFEGKANCIACHDGPLFSKAAGVGPEGLGDKQVERMLMKDGMPAIYDNGFYNIGVRPTAEDIGLGGTDAYGVPLSFTRQWVTNQRVDSFDVEPCRFEVPFPGQDQAGCGNDVLPPGIDLKTERIAVDGAFKTPILRNIAVTPPYFHNGGQASLAQVVAFYNRGGDFSNREKDPDVTRLGLSQTEQDALVAFLQSLTDDRVRCSRAPFDHPELLVPDGQKPNVVKSDGRLADKLRTLAATGAGGDSSGSCLANAGDLFEIARNINGLPVKQ
jgi:cytochrome c peroxidase